MAGKPWNRASSGTKATTKGKKSTSTVKKKKKSKLINPSKTIIPVTTYLRRTRVSGPLVLYRWIRPLEYTVGFDRWSIPLNYKMRKLVDPWKAIIPVTTYLRRTRVSEPLIVPLDSTVGGYRWVPLGWTVDLQERQAGGPVEGHSTGHPLSLENKGERRRPMMLYRWIRPLEVLLLCCWFCHGC